MLIASQYGIRSGQVSNQGGIADAQTQFSTDTQASRQFQPLSFSRLDTSLTPGETTGDQSAAPADTTGSSQTSAGNATRMSGNVRLGTIIDILV